MCRPPFFLELYVLLYKRRIADTTTFVPGDSKHIAAKNMSASLLYPSIWNSYESNGTTLICRHISFWLTDLGTSDWYNINFEARNRSVGVQLGGYIFLIYFFWWHSHDFTQFLIFGNAMSAGLDVQTTFLLGIVCIVVQTKNSRDNYLCSWWFKAYSC